MPVSIKKAKDKVVFVNNKRVTPAKKVKLYEEIGRKKVRELIKKSRGSK